MLTIQTLKGRWSEFSFNPFASHSLRVLVQLIHGSPLEAAGKKSVRSKKSKKYMESKSGGEFKVRASRPLLKGRQSS